MRHANHLVLPAVLFAVCSGPAQVQAADAPALRVAVGSPYVPFEFKVKNELVGFDIALWQAIAREAKMTYTFEVVPFEEILPVLSAGGADIGLGAISITPARQAVVDFSDPYYVNGLAVMVGAQRPDVLSTVDFDRKWVGVKTGSKAADYFTTHAPKARVKIFPNIDTAYLALMTQGVEAVVHETFALQYFAAHEGSGRAKVNAILVSDDPFGIAFPKHSPWLPKVNQALTALRASGEYDVIYRHWFGATAALTP